MGEPGVEGKRNNLKTIKKSESCFDIFSFLPFLLCSVLLVEAHWHKPKVDQTEVFLFVCKASLV